MLEQADLSNYAFPVLLLTGLLDLYSPQLMVLHELTEAVLSAVILPCKVNLHSNRAFCTAVFPYAC